MNTQARDGRVKRVS